MASKSVTRAITGNNGSYSRILGNFRGVDLSSDPSQVAPDRMAYSVNMWRDYESENGGAIETIPGFRKLFGLGEKIHGIFSFGEYLVVHSGTSLYRIPKNHIENEKITFDKDNYELTDKMNAADSSAFEYNGKLYILDGKAYRYVTNDENDKTVHNVADGDAYIPTSYYNYQPYEQRNMLQTKFINKKTFLRENPVNRAIPVEKYFEFKYKGTTATIQNSEYRGKVYIPSEYMKKEKNSGGEEVETEYTISLFGECKKVDKDYIITGSFANSDIEQVVIDDGITEIPAYCFANCKKLKRVVVLGRVDRTGAESLSVQKHAFYNCSNLTEFWYGYNKVSENDLENLPGNTSYKELDFDIILCTGTNYDLSHIHSDPSGNPQTVTEPEIILIDGETGIELLENSENNWEIIASKPYAFSLLKYYFNSSNPSYAAVNIFNNEYCLTNYEGELWWYNFTIMDPCKEVTAVKANGKQLPIDEFVGNKDETTGYITSVDVLLPRSCTEEDVEIYGKGELNNFATVKNMADIYQSTTLDKNKTTVEAIGGCTVSCAFDGRVFFTGNKELPNTVFYTQRNNTGANDPSYIGVYNYINDGVGSIPNVAMIAASSMLMVFKQDTTLEGSVFYHTGQDNADTTSQDLIPRIYPSVQGVAGIGCLGAACNFADDAVFISKKGLEAIGKEQVNLERTIQHRSGRIDASLWHTIGKDTKLAEWKGYLVVLTKGGKMYLADSRRVALMQSTGEYQYEWFYLDGIGSYDGDSAVYTYVDTDVAYLENGSDIFKIENLGISKATKNDVLSGEVKSVKYPDENGETIYFEIKADGRKLLVENTSEKTGGTLSPATVLLERDGDLYFGCENGDVCVFNTDKRGVAYTNPYSGDTASIDITEIHPAWYNRCGHRYISGFSTLADNCGYPHFNKSTCGKTLTIKAKNMRNSAFSLRARTNREDWKDIERYVSAECDFSYLDFNNANFQTREQQIFSSREKMKKWAEKQLYFFSDGFCEPFGIYNLAYVFEIVGKVK